MTQHHLACHEVVAGAASRGRCHCLTLAEVDLTLAEVGLTLAEVGLMLAEVGLTFAEVGLALVEMCCLNASPLDPGLDPSCFCRESPHVGALPGRDRDASGAMSALFSRTKLRVKPILLRLASACLL